MSKGATSSASIQLIVLVCSFMLLHGVMGQLDDDWIDPYDMLNYDASTKTMRKQPEPTHYPSVPTKRREHIQEDSNDVELKVCNQKVEVLQRDVDDQRKRMAFAQEQPTCTPVFKRFLTKLLKEIDRVGVTSDSQDMFYDAKVRLSPQAVAEIRKLLEGEESWRTGALDDAVSQILVDLKPHDYEAWRWRFEDTFGVEIDTVLKVSLFVVIIVVIIGTQYYSAISWFIQFKRMFVLCFFISIIWNWFYLYKIAFAEHQNNMVKMDSVNGKCTGMKKIDWSDSLKEWFRSTWTLQDDPCKRYYEVLMVNPILLVPPTKAIAVTFTTFITEPMKHVGQGISDFLIALLKDLPVTLQIPVFLTIVIAIVVLLYAGVQGAFQYGITAPLRRRQRDPPVGPNPARPLRDGRHERLAVEDVSQRSPRPRANQSRPGREDQVRQRRHTGGREPAREVETLRHRADEMDAAHMESSSDAEHPERGSPYTDSQVEEDSNQEETDEEVPVDGTSNVMGNLQVKQPEAKGKSSSSQVKTTKSSVGKTKPSQGEGAGEGVAATSQPTSKQDERPTGNPPSQENDAQTEDKQTETLEMFPSSQKRTPWDRISPELGPSQKCCGGPSNNFTSVISIAQLHPYKTEWLVRARVTKKNDIHTWRNPQGESKLFSFNVADESGEIQIKAFSTEVDTFFPLVEQGKVYLISKATVKAVNKHYSIVRNNYEITLNCNSNLVLCDDNTDIPTLSSDL